LECGLVEGFKWSLREIDETDMDSLLSFVFYWPVYKKGSGKKREVFVDEVDWL
jgi:hypothetical protein